MKKGVSFFTFPQNVDILEACRVSKDAGYDGVELVMAETGAFSYARTEAELIRLRRQINDMGLEVLGVGAWDLWKYNLAAANNDAAKDVVKHAVDGAQALGTDAVLIVPGWVGTSIGAGDRVRYDHAYDNCQKALSALAPYAEQAGVALAVENVWNKFLLSPIETKRFLDEIGSAFVGAYFDVGNIIYIGYPDQWIEILGDHIKRLHFCDCRAECAGMSMFVDLFEGDVDFDAVMAACKTIGYDGWATVEFFPNYRRYPYQSIINAKLSLDRIIH